MRGKNGRGIVTPSPKAKKDWWKPTDWEQKNHLGGDFFQPPLDAAIEKVQRHLKDFDLDLAESGSWPLDVASLLDALAAERQRFADAPHTDICAYVMRVSGKPCSCWKAGNVQDKPEDDPMAPERMVGADRTDGLENRGRSIYRGSTF